MKRWENFDNVLLSPLISTGVRKHIKRNVISNYINNRYMLKITVFFPNAFRSPWSILSFLLCLLGHFSILCLFYIFIALLKCIHLSFSISLINLNDFTVNHFLHKVISLRHFTTFNHFQILMFTTCSCKYIKFWENINRLYM